MLAHFHAQLVILSTDPRTGSRWLDQKRFENNLKNGTARFFNMQPKEEDEEEERDSQLTLQ